MNADSVACEFGAYGAHIGAHLDRAAQRRCAEACFINHRAISNELRHFMLLKPQAQGVLSDSEFHAVSPVSCHSVAIRRCTH